ncbi:MAG: membrane protein insertion efficiency factor YidD [Flavobacteriales bacterium]|nr:membrane protein insertion efficiency factor YidD [Flavobacteriales bacterium]
MSKFLSSLLLFMIYLYQKFISPMMPASCRYTPTCSQYSKESIIKYGPFKGTYIAFKRVIKCHPWGGSGYDPIP